MSETNGRSQKTYMLNMGPQHPAMHGVVRLILELEGERIVGADFEMGYLHRAFEKHSETETWNNVIPWTDRLNYVSPLINNVGYCMAVEKLAGIEIPERGQYLRVIASEVSRITDHLTCIGATAMELGAFTVFLYMIKAREYLYELIESVTGARLTISYARVGGLKADLPADFGPRLTIAIKQVRDVLKEIEQLLNTNRIFIDRIKGTGAISKEQALAYGMTGPFLRSTGVDYDVRKDHPYLVYDRLEFDVPVGSTGDNLDRYLVRLEEMRQSIRMLRQCLRDIPAGPVIVDDPRVALPGKKEAYNTIEAMIRHFKHIVDGIRVPPGEAYAWVEGGNGELGFFIVSDGTGRPWKCYCRAPSFINLQTISKTIDKHLISDIVPIFGMINMIGGECDK